MTVKVIGSCASWLVAMVRLPVWDCRACSALPTSAVDREEAEADDSRTEVAMRAVEELAMAALESETLADDVTALDVRDTVAAELDRAALAALTSMATMEISYRERSSPVTSQCSLFISNIATPRLTLWCHMQ